MYCLDTVTINCLTAMQMLVMRNNLHAGLMRRPSGAIKCSDSFARKCQPQSHQNEVNWQCGLARTLRGSFKHSLGLCDGIIRYRSLLVCMAAHCSDRLHKPPMVSCHLKRTHHHLTVASTVCGENATRTSTDVSFNVLPLFECVCGPLSIQQVS